MDEARPKVPIFDRSLRSWLLPRPIFFWRDLLLAR